MLYGQKVALRCIEEGDLPLLVNWRNDPRTRTRFFAPFLLAVSNQKKWYEGLLNDPSRIWFMIIHLQDHVPVGTIALNQIDYRNQSFEPSGLIIDPAYRGQGLGLDANRVMHRYAFQELNLHRAHGYVFAFNQTALRGYLELGFKQEGLARKAAFVEGEFHDVIRVALLREEWLELQSATADRKPLSPNV